MSGIGLGLLYEKPSLLSTLLSVRTLQDVPNLFLTISRTMLICQDPASNSHLCGLPYSHLLIYTKTVSVSILFLPVLLRSKRLPRFSVCMRTSQSRAVE